jgi:hypothetical protein
MLAGSCARTCVLVSARFGDVPVLLRNSKDQNVEKPKNGKDGKNLLWVRSSLKLKPACLCQFAQAILSGQALSPLPVLSAAIAMIAAPTGFTGLFTGAGGLLNSIFPGASTVRQRRRASRQSHKSTETPDGRRIRRRDPWVLLERGLHLGTMTIGISGIS